MTQSHSFLNILDAQHFVQCAFRLLWMHNIPPGMRLMNIYSHAHTVIKVQATRVRLARHQLECPLSQPEECKALAGNVFVHTLSHGVLQQRLCHTIHKLSSTRYTQKCTGAFTRQARACHIRGLAWQEARYGAGLDEQMTGILHHSNVRLMGHIRHLSGRLHIRFIRSGSDDGILVSWQLQ